MKKVIVSISCSFVLLMATAFNIPKGWLKSGSMASKYEVGVLDTEESGRKLAYLKSVDAEITGFGTLMRQFSAIAYKGKRVAFTAKLKTTKVGGWAGLWMRIDQQGANKAIAFDNMESRPLKGDTEWTQCTIVLDVPVSADLISFGVLLNGTGVVLLDAVKINLVDQDTPTTAASVSTSHTVYPIQPLNLDFKQ